MVWFIPVRLPNQLLYNSPSSYKSESGPGPAPLEYSTINPSASPVLAMILYDLKYLILVSGPWCKSDDMLFLITVLG